MSDLPGEPGDDAWLGLSRLLRRYADLSDDASLGPEPGHRHLYRDFERRRRNIFEPDHRTDPSDESDLGSVRPTPPQTAPESPQTAPNPRNDEMPTRSGNETPARI